MEVNIFTNSQYPSALDTDAFFMSPPNNNSVFTVRDAIGVDDLQVRLLGSGTITPPTMMVFDGGEIWLVEDATFSVDHWIIQLSDYSKRGVGLSPEQAHPSGELVYFGLLGDHLNRIRDAIFATQKSSMRHVVTLPAANDPAAFIGEVVYNLADNKVYYRTTTTSWTWANRLSHSDLTDLTNIASHTIYNTEADVDAWHAGLAGVHIQNGDNHKHIVTAEGDPVKRISAGLLSARGTPSQPGQTYFATDDRGGTLYISIDGVSWQQVSGAPDDAIAMFSGSCPSGWQRYTALDDKFPVPSAVGTGSKTHSHTYSQILNHYHNVALQAVNTSNGGAHSHTVNVGSGVGANYAKSYGNGSAGTGAAGDHTHSVTIQRVIDSAGTTNPSTSTDEVLPPYREVMFCKKGVV